MLIVCDTSPLRYLCELGAVDLLPSLYGTVMTTPLVMSELQLEYFPDLVKRWAGSVLISIPRQFFADFPSFGIVANHNDPIPRKGQGDFGLTRHWVCRKCIGGSCPIWMGKTDDQF